MLITRRNFLTGLASGCACAITGLPARSMEIDLREGIVCSLFGGPSFGAVESTRQASPETLEAVASVSRALGIAPNFDVMEADIEKWAGFATIRDDKRYIVLDPIWLGRGWRSIGLIGHEIGHHLQGHTVRHKKPAWGREMEADFTAGRAISFMGGSLDDAQSWWSAKDEGGTNTHPPRDMRLRAVEAGWNQAQSLKVSTNKSCATDWLGDPMDVNGQTCRMVRICEGAQTDYRLACRNGNGDWIWQR